MAALVSDPSGDLAATLKLVRKLLRGRQVAGRIDELSTGAPDIAFCFILRA